MKILITGINGFAGEYITRHLLKTKDNIEIAGTVLNNKGLAFDKVKLYACDIQDSERVGEIITEFCPDQIYHLAAIASAADDDNKEIFNINVQGTLNILEALEKNSQKIRIILASTGYVYGSTKNDQLISFKEEDKADPRGLYAESKYKMEKEARKYFNSPNLEIIITRAFNHTGPKQPPQFVVPAFCEQIAKIEKGELDPVMAVGNLEAVRDFADVRDVARAYTEIMEKGKSYEIYNIASGRGYAIQEILDKIIILSNKKIEIKRDPNRMRKSDLAVSVGSFEKLNKLCGWKPEISLEQTLEDTLNYWRK